MTIQRLLVANRGEIARRVIRTCRALGISPVAVYSDPDAGMRHVAEADAAVRLPGRRAEETYLRIDALVAAARSLGADAVHPGYGFLAENAAFARAVQRAGLVWVGPPPDAIEAMGSKIAARKLVAAAGVPVLPEYDPALVRAEDLPLLVKASAGGGGRGMRVVRTLDELPGAVREASAEAATAFGEPAVFCERYVQRGRHIEVQVLADVHGTVWAVGARDCSLQRRHQKILEESFALSTDTHDRMTRAAVDAVRAVGYVGAGTVEFISEHTDPDAGPDGGFWFLETNTRLRVEHPVTECVTGLDLVAEQIAIAEGAALPPEPPVRPASTAAIEVRLYAEDPAAGWRPSAGVLHALEIPGVDVEFAVPEGATALRLDAGYVAGDEVGTDYDPMLAKLIAVGPSRAAAARRLAAALSGARIHGVTTNRDLLVRVLREPDFLAGYVDTGYLDVNDLTEPLVGADEIDDYVLAAALADAAAAKASSAVQPAVPIGWRNIASQRPRRDYAWGDRHLDGCYDTADPRVVRFGPDEVVLRTGVVEVSFAVARYGELRCVDAPLGSVTLRALPRFADPRAESVAGSLLAPLPGAVSEIMVRPGERVSAGTTLLVLEAMKMRHPILAPHDGTVGELKVAVHDQVQGGEVLTSVEPAGDEQASE